MALSAFADLRDNVAAIISRTRSARRSSDSHHQSIEEAVQALKAAKTSKKQSIESVAQKLATASSMKRTARQSILSATRASDFLPPYFISPKHDGIRVISFGPAYKTISSCSGPEVEGTRRYEPRWSEMTFWERRRLRQQQELGAHASWIHASSFSCFTRFGRPIVGLHWIEHELLQLRKACGDSNLVLDGELYLHRTDIKNAQNNVSARLARRNVLAASTAANNMYSELSRKAGDEGGLQTSDIASLSASIARRAPSALSLAGQTGFQQVSNLVTSLRAAGLRLEGEHSPANAKRKMAEEPSMGRSVTHDVFDFVSALPRMCVFDIVSYMPPSVPSALMRQAMVLHGISHVSSLRVTPNRTPFIQRLRVLVFLFTMLKLQQNSSAKSSSAGSAQFAGSNAQQQRRDYLVYRGGKYVQLVPYTVVNSLEQVEESNLKWYLRLGYEGAVVRTALNVYSAVWKKEKSGEALTVKKGKRTSSESDENEPPKGLRRSRVGCRSPTAAKLLPVRDSEFVITRVLFRREQHSAKSRKRVVRAVAANPCGLECMTDKGVSFRVTLDTMSAEQRGVFLAALKRRGPRGIIGLYVTLHYPALTAHGVPRFPKIKGLRGGKGWFL